MSAVLWGILVKFLHVDPQIRGFERMMNAGNLVFQLVVGYFIFKFVIKRHVLGNVDAQGGPIITDLSKTTEPATTPYSDPAARSPQG